MDIRMKDRKSHIQSIIKDIVKKKSFPYSKAVTKIKADRKGYYQSKDLKEKKQTLSTDRFQQYLKEIAENDNSK